MVASLYLQIYLSCVWWEKTQWFHVSFQTAISWTEYLDILLCVRNKHSIVLPNKRLQTFSTKKMKTKCPANMNGSTASKSMFVSVCLCVCVNVCLYGWGHIFSVDLLSWYRLLYFLLIYLEIFMFYCVNKYIFIVPDYRLNDIFYFDGGSSWKNNLDDKTYLEVCSISCQNNWNRYNIKSLIKSWNINRELEGARRYVYVFTGALRCVQYVRQHGVVKC